MEGNRGNQRLFWGCFIALIATSFGFIIRALIIDDWGTEFGLTATQKGEIFGVGLWPFAISIILFSLFIDKIGYGRAMVFAFACHVISAIITIFAKGYWSLWIGTFIVALANGTVEAVINPVVATMFTKEKTKWLNILHAGWPGGLVLGGLLVLGLDALGPEAALNTWKVKVALIFIPTILYAIMLIRVKFPVQERVAAGVTHRDMLKELGAIGALIVSALMVFEVGRVFNFHIAVNLILIAVLTIGYGLYVQSLGRPMFIFLALIMMPLATTELGTDSWVTDLMKPEMGKYAGWILVYTSFIMMVLRFCAGPIIHRISPLGLLAVCSAIAALGLFSLSFATGAMILVAATIYGIGKTFFWPTMLGVVSEQYPKGGAMTLNAMGGIGMLSVGVVGAVFLGQIQDNAVDQGLVAYDKENETAIHATYVTLEKKSIFGNYMAIDADAFAEAPEEVTTIVGAETGKAKKGALKMVAIFPIIMMISFLILLFYFKSKGGYKAVELAQADAPAEAPAEEGGEPEAAPEAPADA